MVRRWRKKETIVKNMTTTMGLKPRRSVGLNVIRHVVRQRSEEVYVRVTTKRLTTPEATEQVHWQMFVLASHLVQRIGHVSPNVLNLLF